MIDAQIVLTQYLLQNEKRFKEKYNFKIKRTFERIEKGYYKK